MFIVPSMLLLDFLVSLQKLQKYPSQPQIRKSPQSLKKKSYITQQKVCLLLGIIRAQVTISLQSPPWLGNFVQCTNYTTVCGSPDPLSSESL